MTADGGKSKNNMSTPQWGGHNDIMSTISFRDRHVFTAILCKFGEDIFITEQDVKLDFKM